MKTKKSYFFTLLFALALYANQSSAAWEKDRLYNLTILHTNDSHGHYWKNKNNEGGLAAQYTIVKKIRDEVAKKNGDLLILSAGDVNSGAPESGIQFAEPDLRGMNLIGYDVMTIGHSEYDNPPYILGMQEMFADFPFLSANIYNSITKQRPYRAYLMINKRGLAISVIGLTTPDTSRLSSSVNLSNIEITDPIAEAKTVIEDLKAWAKPDISIALTHLGHFPDGKHGDNAVDDVTLARALKPGDLDIIIGGHSETLVCMLSATRRNDYYTPGSPCKPDHQNGTYIFQAHPQGKSMGRADFTYKNGKLTLVSYELIPINMQYQKRLPGGKFANTYYTEEIPEDPEMLAFLTPYKVSADTELGRTVGETQITLQGNPATVRKQQTNLGRLVAYSQMKAADADFGIVNSGSIQGSISIGNITYLDVLNTLPKGYQVVYTEMKGSELIDYLNTIVRVAPGSEGYAQFANVNFGFSNQRVEDVKINRAPLDPNKVYRFSLTSFSAEGGANYPKVAYTSVGKTDATVLRDFISKNKPIRQSLIREMN